MKTKVTAGLGALLGVPLLLGACELADPAASGTARVTVLLTDAPGDLASAEVEIREIYLQGGGGEGEGGRLVLFSGSRSFDLLQLRDGVTAEIAEATVPPGRYAQLRMVISEATITTEAGATYSTAAGTLQCPSCDASGLKVQLAGGGVRLDPGEQSVLLDFDVAQSFGRLAGRSGRWVMRPLITAVRLEAVSAIEGTVALDEGVTLPECGATQAELTHFVPTAAAGELSFTGQTGADGRFRFHFVAPGAYTLGFAEQVPFDDGAVLHFEATPSVPEVTVTSGSVSTLDYLITSAVCEPPADEEEEDEEEEEGD